jgi:hypothetical protein
VGKLLWNCGHVDVKASIPRQAFSSEETVPLTITIINQSNARLELHSVVLKQKTSCKTPDDTKGPKTERIHRLEFSETYLPHLREINRVINFPIPPAAVWLFRFLTIDYESFDSNCDPRSHAFSRCKSRSKGLPC